jgi:YVTN family beta-propeller protein
MFRRLAIVTIPLALAAGAACGQYLEATIRVNYRPSLILWTPTSNKVYVGSTYDENVFIIDAASLRVTGGIQLADQPSSMCWNSVNNKLYVATSDNNSVVVIDCAGDSIITTLHVSGGPVPMAYNSTLNKLYVGAYEYGYVSVFGGGDDTLLGRVYVDNLGVWNLLWHPGTDRLFCSTAHDSVRVIDCETDRVVCTLAITEGTWDFALNSANDFVYVAGHRATQALSPLGDSVVATIAVKMADPCVVPYPNKLYGRSQDTIRVLDCATHTVVREVVVPWEGFPMVCDTIGGRVYAASPVPQQHDDVVIAIDPLADTVLMEITVGAYPVAMTQDWFDDRIFVANGMDTIVSVIHTNVGIQEEPRSSAVRYERPATISRGTLVWPAAYAGRLLDLSGRIVVRLQPGMNRLPGVAPGVYFAMCADGTRAARVAVVQ